MGRPKPHTDRGPDSTAAPLEMPRPHGISLFWRTFFFLALLLVGCILAWLQTFRALEFEPRTLQSAQLRSTVITQRVMPTFNATAGKLGVHIGQVLVRQTQAIAVRAEAVQRYLAAQGIEPPRMVARGLGKDYPVASNDSSARPTSSASRNRFCTST